MNYTISTFENSFKTVAHIGKIKFEIFGQNLSNMTIVYVQREREYVISTKACPQNLTSLTKYERCQSVQYLL